MESQKGFFRGSVVNVFSAIKKGGYNSNVEDHPSGCKWLKTHG